ncbi:T9SS type A sorting domain-containing protein [bacterium]|nr:T9SS type A sorting domain-containing protein [bacterium]
MERRLFVLSCLFLLFIMAVTSFAAEWRFSVVAYPGDRSTFSTLTLGTDLNGSDMFESMPGEALDVPFFPPPDASFFYFPLTDPDFPHITMLGTDIRDAEDDTIIWTVFQGGDDSADHRLITWNLDNVPGPTVGYYYIGAGVIGFDITSWIVMTSVDSFMFADTEYVAIKFLSESSIDVQAPMVTSFQPLGMGVEVDRNIQFVIFDDMSGVDLASLFLEVDGVDVSGDVLATETTYLYYNGYDVVYDPPADFDHETEICVRIWAKDLEDPAHEMDTLTYCFVTQPPIPPDSIPPYTEQWTPANGATGVNIYATISVKIKDGGVGVDDESIILNVNGANVTGMATIGAIDHPLSGNYLVRYEPVMPLPPNNWNTAWVYAEDMNGNAVADTIMFRTGLGEDTVASWLANITVWSRIGSDTTFRERYFGVSRDGSDGYDTGVDVPLVLCMPGAPCMYFLLNDPEYPSIDKLQTDVRDNMIGTKYWKLYVKNPGDNLGTYWDNDELPSGLTYFIGLGDSLTPPAEDNWYNMHLYNSLPFSPGQVVWIKYFTDTLDIAAPYVLDSDPINGAAGVDVTEPVYVEICDAGSGVEMASIMMMVNGIDVTSEVDMGTLGECGGYSLLYDHAGEPFPPYSTVCVRIIALDQAIPPNELDTLICFSVSPGPIWTATLTYHEDDGIGENLYSLVIGTAENGAIGCDPNDAGFPLCPPSGLCVYFPVDDPGCMFDHLTTDIRNRGVLDHTWLIQQENADDGNSYWVSWNPTALLPTEEDWHFSIAAVYPGDSPAWVDMHSTSMIDVEVGQQVWVHVWNEEDYYDLCGNVTLEDATDYSNIYVYMITGTGDTLLTEMTDASGDYCFLDNYPANYTLCYHYEGYYDQCFEVDLDEDIIMETTELLLFCYEVSGVVDIEGLPSGEWGGSVVNFTSPTQTLETTTADDGSYMFDCAHAGTYTVTISHIGYPDVEDEVTVIGDMSGVNFTIVEGCFMLQGTVTLAGTPAEGIMVMIPGLGTYYTDASGHYVDSCVYAGDYTITASYNCFLDADTTIEFLDHMTVNLNLQPRMVSISGTASLEGVSDFSGILITLNSVPFTTDETGEYEFTDLACGADYILSASINCYYTVVETLTSVDDDVVYNFTIPAIPFIPELYVVADTLARPLIDDTLFITLFWDEPTVVGDSIGIFIAPEDGYSDYIWDWTYLGSIPFGTGLGDLGLGVYGLDEGVSYCFTMVTFYGDDYCDEVWEYACGTVLSIPDPNTLLIYDFDNGATPIGGIMGVDEAMAMYLDDLDVSYTITDQDASLDMYVLDDYEAIFIGLGIQDADDTKIPESSLDMLMDYLDERNPIYIEGPDFAAEYSSGSATEQAFFDYFGVSFIEDGYVETTGNVDSLFSYVGGSFFGPRFIVADYDDGSLADRYIDVIDADGATMILHDQDGNARVAAYTHGYQTVLSACYAGAMELVAAPFGPARIYDAILNFFGIEPGISYVYEKENIPTDFVMNQNYPNPFNPTTTIQFGLPADEAVEVAVFNIYGEKMVTLIDGLKAAGTYTVMWDGRDMSGQTLPSGVYFCQLQTPSYSKVVKMMFMK